jgi:hypothetical protein
MRKAADYVGLAINTFSKGMAAGLFVPQAKIESDPRPAFGFETAYLDEIKRIIVDASDRAQGAPIFTNDVREKLLALAKKWAKK